MVIYSIPLISSILFVMFFYQELNDRLLSGMFFLIIGIGAMIGFILFYIFESKRIGKK